VNLFLDGDELYVANFAERCVDVFDVKRLTYKRSISNGERTFVRDIYVEDGHLFVAAGDSREVQVFDKHSGTYLTRLGTGIWPVSNVSWAGCVAATKNFVFVRDSKETNVRVFDRKAVLLTAVNNNTVFAKLGTGSDFIGSSTEPHGESYDMEV
jgi:DNA-binding beta-propeller fold protein YncE